MKYKTILWDFDGVIIDSMKIRDLGFVEVFKDYPKSNVDSLLDFHMKNGGLSRYVKIRYFYNEILKQPISDLEVEEIASQFSSIMRANLLDAKLLIHDSIQFIKQNANNLNFHIVSGSDQNELRFLCNSHNIDQHFLSINGSPTPKIQLVKDVMSKFEYNNEDVVLIGDSYNDFEAASINNIDFLGYNNDLLKNKGVGYIESFSDGGGYFH